jgi:hypothetical protein
MGYRIIGAQHSNPCAGTKGYENQSKPCEARCEGSSEGLRRLAAKARLLERLVTGDVRVLAEEIREGLEALCGPGDEVVDIAGRRGVRS